MTPASQESSGWAEQRFAVVLAALSLAALGLRAWGLAELPLFADDVGVRVSAINFVERGRLGPTMWQHPHLRDLLVYFAVSLLGPGKIGLTAFSMLLGVLSVPLLGVVTRALFRSATAGLLAALLLGLDSLHIDYSRQAIQEVYLPFFTVAGVGLALWHRDRGRASPLLLAGACLGLAVASKWHALATPLVLWIWLAARAVKERAVPLLVFRTCALLLIGLAVYLATFTPYFSAGHSAGEWFALQRAMLAENIVHQGLSPADAFFEHRPWTWFIRPVGYADFAPGPEPVAVVAITNPLVWMLVLPAMGWVVMTGVRLRCERHLLLAALFLASYVPLVFVGRPIWLHTAHGVLPFALAAVAAAAARLASKARGRAVAVYLVAVVLASMPLYLLATGQGLRFAPLRPVAMSFRPPPNLER